MNHLIFTHRRDLADVTGHSYEDLKAEHDSLQCPPASCSSPAHADELADFGDCSACGTVASRLPVPAASAAGTPGTIASACAFGWGT